MAVTWGTKRKNIKGEVSVLQGAKNDRAKREAYERMMEEKWGELVDKKSLDVVVDVNDDHSFEKFANWKNFLAWINKSGRKDKCIHFQGGIELDLLWERIILV